MRCYRVARTSRQRSVRSINSDNATANPFSAREYQTQPAIRIEGLYSADGPQAHWFSSGKNCAGESGSCAGCPRPVHANRVPMDAFRANPSMRLLWAMSRNISSETGFAIVMHAINERIIAESLIDPRSTSENGLPPWKSFARDRQLVCLHDFARSL